MKIVSEIANGAYSTVHEVDGKNQVVKRNVVDKTSDFIRSLKEMDMLVRLNHPGIVKIESVIFDDVDIDTPSGFVPDHIHFVLEKASYDLSKLDMKICNIDFIRVILCECLVALEYMHLVGIIHRDIKPANILLFEETRNVKYCDFGLSCYYSKGIKMSREVCTLPYRAPELLVGENYNEKSDIWSLAITFIEIVTGRDVLKICTNKNSTLKSIVETLPDAEDYILSKIDLKYVHKSNILDSIKDDKFRDLLSKMLITNPDKRLSATDCLNHPFFDEIKQYISSDKPEHINKFAEIEYQIDKEKRQEFEFFETINEIRDKSLDSFYFDDRVYYQALDLFDRCISVGISHIYLVQSCMYISSKLMCDTNFPYSFCEVNFLQDDIDKEELLDLEKDIVKYLRYSLYRPTLYEFHSENSLPKDWSLMKKIIEIPTGNYTIKDLSNKVNF